MSHKIFKDYFEELSASDPAMTRAYLDGKRGVRGEYKAPAEAVPLAEFPKLILRDPYFCMHSAGRDWRINSFFSDPTLSENPRFS